ncbi:MAG: hypothetical protein KDA68_07395, partial [Planctomycetaceae bacterium]|nr:hypothetical protein [Planctomycetaceae bacterium]
MIASNRLRSLILSLVLGVLFVLPLRDSQAESPPPKKPSADSKGKNQAEKADQDPEKTAEEKAETEELPEDPNANPNSIIGAQANLPLVTDLPIPTSGELLQALPYDWVILITEKVVIADPVAPRPNT